MVLLPQVQNEKPLSRVRGVVPPNKALDRSHRRELLIKVIRFYHLSS
jgi:hypothetical protein